MNTILYLFLLSWFAVGAMSFVFMLPVLLMKDDNKLLNPVGMFLAYSLTLIFYSMLGYISVTAVGATWEKASPGSTKEFKKYLNNFIAGGLIAFIITFFSVVIICGYFAIK